MPWREAADPQAWADLSPGEDPWEPVYNDLGFRPSMHPQDWPGFVEPAGSTT
ncbi:MAG: DUF2716 domain-containing protein [Actinomycetia bacterium]|nr:DUF2716 domain-containing protein [Actinomycetes bacterium]